MASGYDRYVEYDIEYSDFKFEVGEGYMRLYDDYGSVIIYNDELRTVGEKLIDVWASGALICIDEEEE